VSHPETFRLHPMLSEQDQDGKRTISFFPAIISVLFAADHGCEYIFPVKISDLTEVVPALPLRCATFSHMSNSADAIALVKFLPESREIKCALKSLPEMQADYRYSTE